MITSSEDIKPLHRERGSHPHSTFRAARPRAGEAQLLLTLRWSNNGPGAATIDIPEPIPDCKLPQDARDRGPHSADRAGVSGMC